VLSGLIKFCIQFFIFALFVFYYYNAGAVHPNYWILLTPFLIILTVILSLGFGMLVSSLTTKYKDLIFLITFGIQLLMFATPVLYPLSIIPSKYLFFIKLNPLTGIFECLRFGFFGNGDINLELLFISTFISIVILVAGVLVFNKVEKDFIDTV
jgi:lipopolysaccharide transport system permease protein